MMPTAASDHPWPLSGSPRHLSDRYGGFNGVLGALEQVLQASSGARFGH